MGLMRTRGWPPGPQSNEWRRSLQGETMRSFEAWPPVLGPESNDWPPGL